VRENWRALNCAVGPQVFAIIGDQDTRVYTDSLVKLMRAVQVTNLSLLTFSTTIQPPYNHRTVYSLLKMGHPLLKLMWAVQCDRCEPGAFPGDGRASHRRQSHLNPILFH
jgi:hypothetical protein